MRKAQRTTPLAAIPIRTVTSFLTTGSTAAGIGDVVEDDTVKVVAKIVEEGAEMTQELIAEYEEENKDNDDDEADD